MYPTEESINHYLRVYDPQIGRGPIDSQLQVYVPSFTRQRGRGLGSLLKGVLSKLVPFAKNILFPMAKQYVVPELKTAARNIVTDVIDEKNIADSFKKHSLNVLKNSSKNLLNDQLGSGSQRKRKRALPPPRITRSRKQPRLELASFLTPKRRKTKKSVKKRKPRRDSRLLF